MDKQYLKLPVNGLNWIKNTPKFDEEVIKSMIKTETNDFFVGVNIKYLKQVHRLHDDLPILPEKN